MQPGPARPQSHESERLRRGLAHQPPIPSRPPDLSQPFPDRQEDGPRWAWPPELPGPLLGSLSPSHSPEEPTKSTGTVPGVGWGKKPGHCWTQGPPSLDRRHLGLRKESWVQSEGWRPVSGVTSAPPGGLRLSRFNQLCALIHSPVHPGGTCSPRAPPVFWGAPPPSGPLPFPARHAVSLTGVRGSHAEPHPHTSPWPGLGLENHLSLHPPDW